MDTKKLIILNYLAALLSAVILIFQNLCIAQGSFDLSNKHFEEHDRFGRIINSPKTGKLNYDSCLHTSYKDFLSTQKAEKIGASQKEYLQKKFGGQKISTLPMREVWKTGVFGRTIGGSGLYAKDIDGDGLNEIVCPAGFGAFGLDNYWYIVKYIPALNDYRIQWISDYIDDEITTTSIYDLDGDGIYEIIHGYTSGTIRIYNGKTLNQTASFNLNTNWISKILYADADNDGEKELAICTEDSVYLYSAKDFSCKQVIGFGAGDMAVGNVDSDPENEIVLSSGIILKVNSSSVLWQDIGFSFGAKIALADINDDSIMEVVGGVNDYNINVFDIKTKSVLLTIQGGLFFDALLIADIDNDGSDELLYGDSQWGNIYCYDFKKKLVRWQISNPGAGVTNIGIGDIDNDGKMDIFWGAGASGSGPNNMYIYDMQSQSKKFESSYIEGPFCGIDVGDVDEDGKPEIVTISYMSYIGYGSDGILSIYDAYTKELKWQSNGKFFTDGAWTGLHDVKIGKIGSDSIPKILVATDNVYNGVIHVVNGKTHLVEKIFRYDLGTPMFSLAIGDVDNDGKNEIIAGSEYGDTECPGIYVYIIDGTTGAVKWHTQNLGSSYVYNLKVAKVGKDSTQKIIATCNRLFIIDGITHGMWESQFTGCTGMDITDINKDNMNDIVVGRNNGIIIGIDGNSHTQLFSLKVSNSAIDCLRIADIDHDQNEEIIFTSANKIWVYDKTTSQFKWESPVLGSDVGIYHGLTVANLYHDTASIFVGTNYTVQEYTIAQILTDVKNESAPKQPISYLLSQNYPNPFNPTTIIRYHLPKQGYVNLKVYDILGREVAILVDNVEEAGDKNIVFNAAGFSSGIYLYRLITAGFSETKKMVIVH